MGLRRGNGVDSAPDFERKTDRRFGVLNIEETHLVFKFSDGGAVNIAECGNDTFSDDVPVLFRKEDGGFSTRSHDEIFEPYELPADSKVNLKSFGVVDLEKLFSGDKVSISSGELKEEIS